MARVLRLAAHLNLVVEPLSYEDRCKKRTAAIEKTKLTHFYKVIVEHGGPVSPHPDPTDPSISKREWERLSSLWRARVRDAAAKFLIDANAS